MSSFLDYVLKLTSCVTRLKLKASLPNTALTSVNHSARASLSTAQKTYVLIHNILGLFKKVTLDAGI